MRDAIVTSRAYGRARGPCPYPCKSKEPPLRAAGCTREAPPKSGRTERGICDR